MPSSLTASSAAVGFTASRTSALSSAAVGSTAPYAVSASAAAEVSTVSSGAATFSAATAVRKVPCRMRIIAFCFRGGQPGHFYAECQAIPPVPLNTYPPAPSCTDQEGHPNANYSKNFFGDYMSSSGGDYGPPHQQQMPSPPASHLPRVRFDSSWNSSTYWAVLKQFFTRGESESSSGIRSNSFTRKFQVSEPRPGTSVSKRTKNTTFSSNYLTSAFAV